MQMDKSTKNEIEKFRTSITERAESIIFTKFPAKILELNKLILEHEKPSSLFHHTHERKHTDTTVYHTASATNDPPSKKRKVEESEGGEGTVEEAVFRGNVKSNPHSQKLHAIVKKECEELAVLIDEVKLWVTLTMPRIEDGDNFGVQVQEECLSELHRAQESAYNIRDIPRQDYMARAKIASKILKYPGLEDYVLALKEHDEKQIYYCRQRVRDLRNLYAAITDVLHKNISKIRKPKANNGSGLY